MLEEHPDLFFKYVQSNPGRFVKLLACFSLLASRNVVLNFILKRSLERHGIKYFIRVGFGLAVWAIAVGFANIFKYTTVEDFRSWVTRRVSNMIGDRAATALGGCDESEMHPRESSTICASSSALAFNTTLVLSTTLFGILSSGLNLTFQAIFALTSVDVWFGLVLLSMGIWSCLSPLLSNVNAELTPGSWPLDHLAEQLSGMHKHASPATTEFAMDMALDVELQNRNDMNNSCLREKSLTFSIPYMLMTVLLLVRIYLKFKSKNVTSALVASMIALLGTAVGSSDSVLSMNVTNCLAGIRQQKNRTALERSLERISSCLPYFGIMNQTVRFNVAAAAGVDVQQLQGVGSSDIEARVGVAKGSLTDPALEPEQHCGKLGENLSITQRYSLHNLLAGIKNEPGEVLAMPPENKG